jgi:hypothetical protein
MSQGVSHQITVETNTSRRKADYTIVTIIFHDIWIFVEYQYILLYNNGKEVMVFMKGREKR